MLCDECKKNQATVHTISKINGVTTERHLCAACNKKYMSPMMKLSNIGDLFSNFTGLFEPKRESIICPKCGTTSDDFLETGYVGCPNCYKEFASIILPAVQKMQNAVQHVGKLPDGTAKEQSELTRLKQELGKAIEREEFEQATVLRDKIRKLETKQGAERA